MHLLALAGPELGASQGFGPVSSGRRDLPFGMSAKEKSSCPLQSCQVPLALRPPPTEALG